MMYVVRLDGKCHDPVVPRASIVIDVREEDGYIGESAV